MQPFTTKRFETDLKRAKRRGKNLEKLWAVVDVLMNGQPLDPRNRPRRLAREWLGAWECHLAAGWLLTWQSRDDALTLVWTGTRSNLFG